MIDILLFSAIIFISYGVGKLLLVFIIKETDSLIEDFVFSIGLGFGIVGYIVYGLGSFGFLYPGCIIIALLVCSVISFYPFIQFVRRIKWGRLPRWIKNLGGFEKFLLLVLIIISSVCLFGVKAPEIGNDSLSYHLYHPKVFIHNHTIGYIPFTRESLWPYLTEMLFTIGLLLKSIGVVKMFHYFFGILCALSVYAFTRSFFGRKEALLSAALFYSAPGIFMQSVYAYIDLSLCFYSFAALYLVMLWNEKNNIRFLVLSGIFAGLALSVKMIGGFTFIALCIVILFIALRKKFSYANIAKQLFIFCFIAFLISCVWYIRSYLVLKNPLYPFLDNIFKSGWNDHFIMGARRDTMGFLRLPWDLSMHVGKFGEEQIGIIFLAFFPFLFFIPLKEARVRCLVVFLFCYALIWFRVLQNIRFIFVGFAAAYILLSIGFYAASRRYKMGVVKIILSICILFNVSLCVYYNRDNVKLALGLINEEDYLYKHETSYPLAEFVNKNLPADSIVISLAGIRWFYFDREMFDYVIWKKISKEKFSDYLPKLKKRGLVFLLLNEETRLDDYEEIRPMINNRSPIFDFPIEAGDGRIIYHYIYKL